MSEPAPRFLPYGRQLIEDDDVAAVEAVLRSETLTTGPAVAAFEKALAARVGARFAVSCSSGTAALHLAALALDLDRDATVLVPAMTFVATASAARLAGAECAFLDVDPDSGLMGPAALRAGLEAAGAGAKAVFPVHLNGQCVDMEGVAALAAERGLKVVADASHALGSTYRTGAGETVAVGACRHCDMTTFSFHPVKTVAMGEGGAVTTDDAALHERLLRLRNHGIVRAPEGTGPKGARAGPWLYEVAELGLNYRASDLHCALGLSQLGKLDRFVARRRELAALYDGLLAPLAPLVRPVARVPRCDPAWHLYPVLVDFDRAPLDRAGLMARLGGRGIGTQVHYIPASSHPYYRRRYGVRRLPGAEAYYARVLSLPLFPAMADGDAERVAAALEEELCP